MNDEELADTMRRLRDLAAAYGMQWVLDEVDQAISLGFPQTRTLRQTSRRGETTYEDVTDDILQLPEAEESTGRNHRRSEQFVRRRAMTQLEQVELLIQALRKVLVDLDDVAVGSFNTLNSYGKDVAISGISFAPDEGSGSPEIIVSHAIDPERRARLSRLLAQIEEEISP